MSSYEQSVGSTFGGGGTGGQRFSRRLVANTALRTHSAMTIREARSSSSCSPGSPASSRPVNSRTEGAARSLACKRWPLWSSPAADDDEDGDELLAPGSACEPG